ncbi:MGMT family protein [Streptomyces sp. RKAG337]|uniref:MGMT family protein n=1 Tax=Streptomyces sp. RKAG337 TaxID=2893404 RepID=UPI0020342CEA|nr:MGMT family protein [Streptomyces sp. RKAG337]MCM2429716.1 MGMT family protein [Streptomyces sp. RKAG337]
MTWDADGIQGTTWWDVDTDLVPETVDPDAWAALAGTSLAVLAKQLSGTRKDWTSLHTLLEAIPRGRWTTYGDVATVIGSHAVPVATHLATCRQCPNAWRVLTAAGHVSAGFRWTDSAHAGSPASILEAEGIRFDASATAQEARLPLNELRQLLEA